MGEFMTVEEVAQNLRVSRAAVYAWVEQGKLRALKVSTLLRFRREDIEAFLRPARQVQDELAG